MGIKIGDQVTIRRDCTIEELMENKWNNAHKDTLAFLEDAKLDEVFEVTNISKRGNAVIETNDGDSLYINHNLLEVVASADDEDEDYDDEDDEDEATEMTIEEIQEELGYKIKIVG